MMIVIEPQCPSLHLFVLTAETFDSLALPIEHLKAVMETDLKTFLFRSRQLLICRPTVFRLRQSLAIKFLEGLKSLRKTVRR